MTARRALRLGFFLGALLAVAGAAACAQLTGPVPQNLVRVSVGADITFDPASGLYTYVYRVTNEASSAFDVWQFAVSSAEHVSDVTGPPGWTALVDPDRGVVGWAATTMPPPSEHADGGAAPSRPSRIRPGDTLGGFSFRSPEPPVPARYRARGFRSSRARAASERVEEPYVDGTTLAPRRAPLLPAHGETVSWAPRD